VAAGAGDQAAAAVGAVSPVPALCPSSSELRRVLAATDRFLRMRRPVHAFCHAAPDRWLVMGVMLSAAGSLAWFHDTLLPGVDYDAMLAEAETVPPGCEGLTFLPYLAGERTPHFDSDARGAFCGLSVTHGRGALTRAVLEGSPSPCATASTPCAMSGPPPNASRFGGGSRSRLWLETVASVSSCPSSDGHRPGLGVWRRAAGGVAAGVYRDVDQAAAACVRVTDVIDPYRMDRALPRGARSFPRLLPCPPLGQQARYGPGLRSGLRGWPPFGSCPPPTAHALRRTLFDSRSQGRIIQDPRQRQLRRTLQGGFRPSCAGLISTVSRAGAMTRTRSSAWTMCSTRATWC